MSYGDRIKGSGSRRHHRQLTQCRQIQSGFFISFKRELKLELEGNGRIECHLGEEGIGLINHDWSGFD